MEAKKPYQSKTVWMALVVAIAAFIPGAHEFVGQNLELVGIALGGVFALLRVISKGKIQIG